jgi:hypothetical protein
VAATNVRDQAHPRSFVEPAAITLGEGVHRDRLR